MPKEDTSRPERPSGKGDPRNVVDEHGDDCRCKQVSVMTPKELLGTMWRDLAFWKKDKKRKA